MSETATEDGTRVLVLAALLDLTQAADLKATLEEAIGGGSTLAIDASAVQRVSTPCLQVLASAFRSRCAMGLKDASPEFLETVRMLGLSAALGIAQDV